MRDLRARRDAAISRRLLKYLESLLQIFVQLHNRCHIATTVVVIWSRPYGD